MKFFITFFITVLCSSTLLSQTDARSSLAKANQDLSAALQKHDLRTATKHAEEAVKIARSAFGDESREMAVALENLGVVLVADSKFKMAIEPFTKSLEIFKKDPARNGKDAAKILEKLGNAQFKAGRGKEAEATFSQYLAEAEAKFGADSKEAIAAKLATACYYNGSMQPGKAMTELVESYAIALKTFGRESSELDQTATACDGSLIELLWKDEKRLDEGRRKLSELLGYEFGRPVKIHQADFDPPFSLHGPVDVIIHFVVVKVWIDEAGHPKDARQIFGTKQFASLATTAARESTFKPSVQNGKPIPDVMYLAYSFIR